MKVNKIKHKDKYIPVNLCNTEVIVFHWALYINIWGDKGRYIIFKSACKKTKNRGL